MMDMNKAIKKPGKTVVGGGTRSRTGTTPGNRRYYAERSSAGKKTVVTDTATHASPRFVKTTTSGTVKKQQQKANSWNMKDIAKGPVKKARKK